MSLICIYGDSNGAGEWGPVDNETNIIYGEHPEKLKEFLFSDEEIKSNHRYAVTHPGLQYYLTDTDKHCVNFSHGGESNIGNINTLLESLYYGGTGRARVLNPDVIVFFITEPLRDLYNYSGSPDQKTTRKVREIVDRPHTSIEDLNYSLLKYSLDILQEISLKTNIPVITVDGWGKLRHTNTKYSFLYSEQNWWQSYFNFYIPMITSLRTLEAIDDTLKGREIWNAEVRESYLIKYELLEKYLYSKKDSTFPDAGHLHAEGYSKLADILLPVINELINTKPST